MNRCLFSGFVGKEPTIRESQNGMKIARISLAVKRGYKKDNEPDTDWVSIIAFDKKGEFVEKYIKKGSRVIVETHLVNGSYTNKDGQKVYTTDFIIDNIEFAESKATSGEVKGKQEEAPTDDGFVNVDSDIDESLPFS